MRPGIDRCILKDNAMILFEQDYALLPKEHFDYNTPNKSFIKMYAILKQMGIKNNKFFLILLDKDLAGIDPHNLQDNSTELKLRIAQEAKLNPWYCFRSLIRIPATGTDGTPFELSRANLSMIWLFFNHIDNLIIIPRQLGKTIASISITSVVLYVIGEHLEFAMLTKDATLRKANVGRLKDIRDCYPKWFIHKQRSDTDNTEALSYTTLGNKYTTFLGQKSISGAEKLGRGMTVPSQHWDEPAFMSNIDITYPIAISTTNTAIEMAKKYNQPYGNMLTTTAGVLNTPEGTFVHNLMTNSLNFTEKLYDLNNVTELINIVKDNSRQQMVYTEFSYQQLGKTDEWFGDVSARTAGDEDIIARDYLNRWTHSSGGQKPVDKKSLDLLYRSKVEASYIQYIDGFMIKWYIPESVVMNPQSMTEIPILIGMDASENVGRDFTSLVFTDGRDMSVIGVCTCNTTNIIKVAMFICRWLILDNVLFIPERNSVGCAIIDYCLLQLEKLNINPFYRIYNEVIQAFGIGSRKITRAELNRPGFYNDHRNAFGFRTSGASRPFLYKTVFSRLMKTSCHNVRDISLVNQISGLTVKNGRIDHSSGGNDDSVIAYILTGFALFFGENLDMYDFCRGRTIILLKDMVITEDGKTRDIIDLANIDLLKQEIIHLERGAKYESNETIRVEMLHKVNEMKKRLPKDGGDLSSDAQSVTQLKPKKQLLPESSTGGSSVYLSRFFSGI